uniref:Uncharacterized protein n=1 Tax=Trichogramma kaykai TaxID=54128 RepID=A0ABD2XBE4_9HYME
MAGVYTYCIIQQPHLQTLAVRLISSYLHVHMRIHTQQQRRREKSFAAAVATAIVYVMGFCMFTVNN